MGEVGTVFLQGHGKFTGKQRSHFRELASRGEFSDSTAMLPIPVTTLHRVSMVLITGLCACGPRATRGAEVNELATQDRARPVLVVAYDNSGDLARKRPRPRLPVGKKRWARVCARRAIFM